MTTPTERQILGVMFTLEESMRAVEERDHPRAWSKVRQAQQELSRWLVQSPEMIRSIHEDLTSALVNMGFKKSDSRIAASRTIQELGQDSGLEPMLLAAIRKISDETGDA